MRCSACGRETPALSDCGGFYDLKAPVAVRAPMPVPQCSPVITAAYNPPARPEPSAALPKPASPSVLRRVIPLAVILALLVSLAVVVGMLRSAQDEVARLENRLERLEEELVEENRQPGEDTAEDHEDLLFPGAEGQKPDDGKAEEDQISDAAQSVQPGQNPGENDPESPLSPVLGEALGENMNEPDNRDPDGRVENPESGQPRQSE